MMNKIFCGFALLAAAMTVSCSMQRTPVDTFKADSEEFLKGEPLTKEEIFRVFISSDSYQIAQVNSKDTMMRVEDKSGDQFMCEDLSKLDKINEAREAVYTVSLYPDNGRIYQIRPKKLANLIEIDHLIIQDLQRWNVVHPQGKKKELAPMKFEIHYRVVLRKRMSDEAILQEKRDVIKEKSSQ
jgi:hypothetical protein